MSEHLTIQWIAEQRSRAQAAAIVDTHTFRIVLDNLEAIMQREQKLRQTLQDIFDELKYDPSNWSLIRDDAMLALAVNQDARND